MSPDEPVRVVVVHWNQLRGCLRTVDLFRSQTVATSVTVVDNGSDPGALDILRRELPDDVTLIELGTNRGFGPGANVGMRRWLDEDDGEWVAVAPHDAVVRADVLERVLAAADAADHVGVISADVGDEATPLIHPYLGAVDGPVTVVEGFEDADYAHGTLMLLRRPCAASVGLFDERYFAYCEEADLGIRARAAGWRVGVARGAEVRNPEMGPGAAWIDYLQLRNTLLLLREHFGLRPLAFRVLVAAWQTGVGIVRPASRSPFFSVRARLLAVRDLTRGRYGPPPSSLSRS